jgi:hypothetical protein
MRLDTKLVSPVAAMVYLKALIDAVQKWHLKILMAKNTFYNHD